MNPTASLRKMGALIIVIGGGIPGLIAIIMGTLKIEYLLGFHLTAFVFAMSYVFLLGAVIVLVSLLKGEQK